MTVFIVTAGYDYEGYDILHVTDTREKAEAWMAGEKEETYRDNWRIEEWEVDTHSEQENNCHD